jgi:Derlin-2/3
VCILIESAAVAHGHDILLLRIDISRLHIPSFLFVSSAVDLALEVLTFMDPSMRYSRMLEESSFANRKADYFWLLLLSSMMLLVNYINFLSPAS